MKRLYWNLRTGLAGGAFLAADNCPYFISLFETSQGTRCTIMDGYFTPLSKAIKVDTAKRKIREMLR